MIKKFAVILLVLCSLFCVAGCAGIGSGFTAEPTRVNFPIEGYGLQIMADDTYEEKTGGEWDIQLTNDEAFISVMVYKYSDLSDGMTAQDVYRIQNNSFLENRTNVKELEKESTEVIEGKTVTQKLYSAEKDGAENYYASYIFDIPEKETCAWLLISAVPSYYTENKEHLNNIACSLTAVE